MAMQAEPGRDIIVAPETERERSALASVHYLGPAGKRYFAYQSQYGEIGGRIIASKFTRFIQASDRVLDFGCGAGYVLKAVPCGERIGVDINPAALEAAQLNGIACFETLDAVENASFDVAIAHHSLEHVARPLDVLKKIRRKLRPGATLIVTVPIDDWRVQGDYDPTEPNHHLYTWTPLLLGHLLFEAGFDMRTFETSIGANGWFRAFPKFYGVCPKRCLDVVVGLWSWIRKTREIRGIVHTAGQPGSAVADG